MEKGIRKRNELLIPRRESLMRYRQNAGDADTPFWRKMEEKGQCLGYEKVEMNTVTPQMYRKGLCRHKLKFLHITRRIWYNVNRHYTRRSAHRCHIPCTAKKSAHDCNMSECARVKRDIFILEKKMGLFGQSAEKKREKEIRQGAKELTKSLISSGMEKRTAKNAMELLQEVVIMACVQHEGYCVSKRKMAAGLVLIREMLGEMQTKDAAQIKKCMEELAAEFTDVFHECTIRKDDMDFADTYTYINRAAKEYESADRLMLQSELENMEHMICEIIEWEEPDFCALAYFCKFGNRSDLADIENSQRNDMLLQYYHEQYWDDFETALTTVGRTESVQTWIEAQLAKCNP